MGVTNISIVENNIIENVYLMAIHNPLVFVVRATYNNEPPDNIYCSIVGLDDIDYKCIYLRDESLTERDFYFIADEILRSYLGGIADFDQSDDTIFAVPDLAAEVTLTFTDDGNEGEPYLDTQTLMITNASRDYENVNGACLVDLYNNESLTYIGAVGEQLYLYWYNDDATNVIDGSDGIAIGADEDATALNIKNYIINSTDYNTWILGGSGLSDIWSYVLESPPSTLLIFEAQNGSAITFSNVSLPSGFSHTISSNGTDSARLTITLSSQPLTGNWFRFRFVSDNTPMPIAGYVDINESFGISSGQTFAKGFIRKAITPTDSGDVYESIRINDDTFTHTIKAREYCENDVLIKYLDNNGQYRFMPFSKNYSRNSNPKAIGSINELILSLATDKGDTRNIGYKNNDTLRLTAYTLNKTELALMKDLYNSKDVQIYLNKWLRVEVDGDNISKLEKRKFTDITITVKLPKSYNITEL